MKIGFVTQWYPPEPVFVPGELARELGARGHRVRVLTGYPNYPEGRIYPGYRQRWRTSHTGGENVTVRRVPVYPSHDSSPLGRTANFASFAATSALFAPGYLTGADALYVYHPPATAFAAAAVARLARRVPLVLHVQDMWPESVTASTMSPGGGAGRMIERTLSATMRRLYRSATAIAVISPSMAELVVARGADPGRVRVVLNWTDERLFRPVPATASARAALGHRGRCTVMFAGNMGPFQRVETAIRAAYAARDRVDLVLVGSGTEEQRARRLATELGAGNVRFLGRRRPEEMADLYAAADYQLVCLRDLPGLRGTVPSKLQAALACGAPVLVSAAGDAARLVESTGAGLVCPPEDPTALAARLVEAAALPPAARTALRHRAREVYRERMSLRVGADQIEDLLTKSGVPSAGRSGPATARRLLGGGGRPAPDREGPERETGTRPR
ncbi:glycosyltransferase family 4 protein [Plantactinospora sp. BB1]|uniref:glycosyltransferase family 4 protein n=1 Tax=Plantactinospora sp. BB1 TaxID=2071627 RepID=UPI000D15257B|nr:glycosyltransferase family 4 protein [Plantactinospora sp. BB1]AVT36126.1 glycosyltransferase WbuB [Plantactinospora sp. BB1]